MNLTAKETALINQIRAAQAVNTYTDVWFTLHLCPIGESHIFAVRPLQTVAPFGMSQDLLNVAKKIGKTHSDTRAYLLVFEDGITRLLT